MKIKVFQKGFNYSQDGVGNRLVYHLQGCNMRCPWCANPEGMAKTGSFIVNKDFLVDSVCPHGAINGKRIKRSLCKTCSNRECMTLYGSRGIRLSCEEYEIDAIIEEVKQNASLFYDGGGVTFSGGEPTLQFEAISVLLEKLKSLDIHTAMVTNGSHPKLDALFPVIDMLIMDFKHYDNEIHTRATGMGNSITKENMAKALSVHKKVFFRIPVIKGFNESEQDVKNFVTFFKKHKTVNTEFEFLPFLGYGRAKWSQCGKPYAMKDALVGQATIALYEKTFKENNLSVVHT